MIDAGPAVLETDSERLISPPFAEWADLARSNHDAASGWSFSVAGVDGRAVRSLARREALRAAAEFSAKLGVAVRDAGDPEGLIVMTGHQPDLYHPGVWLKDFLLQRMADETGATALDVVVDTDGFDSVSVSSPCVPRGVKRCTHYLAFGAEDACFVGSPVPSMREIDDFCSAVDSMLSSLGALAIQRNFSAFGESLRSAASVADNMAELITIARRRYEASAGTDYLELPLTRLAKTEAWSTFVAGIALEAERFADAYNSALAEYRIASKTRSSAQPFPDLGREGGLVELPVWRIVSGRRSAVRVEPKAHGGARLVGDGGETIVELPADGEAAVAALTASGELLAPKALTLTLFTRVFVGDLMIHGVGGGRYDRVTDAVCGRFYGIEPPAFVVATISMHLPLGTDVVTDPEVAAARERLGRFEHNPDAFVAGAEFISEADRAMAASLVAEKAQLVSAISAPDADKKSLGLRIREVNAGLAKSLGPLRERLAAELAALESQQAVSQILSDRTYPFCLWSPREVAEKAR